MIAVEKEAPYAVAVYRVSEAAIESGRREYTHLLERLKHCLDTDRWPGLCEDQEKELELPDWTFSGVDLRLDIDGDNFSV